VSAVVIAGALLLPRTLLLQLIDASHYNPGIVRHVVENRFGVIHVASYPQEPDNTFGGNAYDGKISVDFMNDTNVIFRLYALAALHPQSREILTIGLSTGAWAAVLQGFPQAQRIDAVEINPGYLDIIPQYPEVRGVLSDPRVHIHIDDGRRWVRRNPQARFDLIVLNTTWHWRSYSSLLLSQDFVRMCKSRLRPDGIFAYNTTESPDAYETMASEFRYVYKLHNFAIGSDRELSLTEASFADTLRAMRVNGEPVIASWNDEATRRIHDDVSEFVPYAEYRAKVVATLGREPEIITDQNLVGEYRHSESSPVADQVRRILARLSGRS
jgi:spermidine synthase